MRPRVFVEFLARCLIILVWLSLIQELAAEVDNMKQVRQLDMALVLQVRGLGRLLSLLLVQGEVQSILRRLDDVIRALFTSGIVDVFVASVDGEAPHPLEDKLALAERDLPPLVADAPIPIQLLESEFGLILLLLPRPHLSLLFGLPHRNFAWSDLVAICVSI